MVEGRQGHLGQGIALVGRLAVPGQRLVGVLRHAPAVEVEAGQDGLGGQVAVVGGLADPDGRLIHLAGVLEHHPEQVLGDRIAPGGGLLEGVQGALVVFGPLQDPGVGVPEPAAGIVGGQRRLASGQGLGQVDGVLVHARGRPERIFRIVRQDVAG